MLLCEVARYEARERLRLRRPGARRSPPERRSQLSRRVASDASIGRAFGSSRPLLETGLVVETHVMSGSNPAAGILEFARQKRPDAVALTTHGRGGISRMLLGSIADKVVRAAHGPVLVYRST